MSSHHWINTAAFIGCIAGGFWIGSGASSFSASTHGSPRVASASAEYVVQKTGPAALENNLQASGKASEGKGPLADEIQWREQLETLPLSQFPTLFEEELKRAGETGRVYLTLQVWQERDLESYISWMKTQPESRLLGQANYSIGGIHDYALKKVAEEDPERAWKLANQCLSPGHGERWTVLRTLISNNGHAALEFFRKHRDVFLISENASGAFYGFEPTKAMPILSEFPMGRERTQIVGTMARYYEDYSKDPKAGEAWFDSLSLEDKKNWSDAAAKGYPPVPKFFEAKMGEFRKSSGAVTNASK